MTGSFTDPSKFQQEQRALSSNTNDSSYPNKWAGDPVTHAESDNFNPHLDMITHYPDGTRWYYDPVQHTYSFEHSSGFHHVIASDHVGMHNPGEQIDFVAGHHAHTVGGSHDQHVAGHQRINVAGGQFEHVAGDSAHHTGGNRAENYAGHMRQQVAGHYEVRLSGENSAMSLGTTWGSNHVSRITITKDNMVISTKGNVTIKTANNVQIGSENGIINISAPTNYIKGAVKIKGDVEIDGHLKMTSMETPMANITTLNVTSGGDGMGNSGSVSPPSFSPNVEAVPTS